MKQKKDEPKGRVKDDFIDRFVHTENSLHTGSIPQKIKGWPKISKEVDLLGKSILSTYQQAETPTSAKPIENNQRSQHRIFSGGPPMLNELQKANKDVIPIMESFYENNRPENNPRRSEGFFDGTNRVFHGSNNIIENGSRKTDFFKENHNHFYADTYHNTNTAVIDLRKEKESHSQFIDYLDNIARNLSLSRKDHRIRDSAMKDLIEFMTRCENSGIDTELITRTRLGQYLQIMYSLVLEIGASQIDGGVSDVVIPRLSRLIQLYKEKVKVEVKLCKVR